MAFKCLFLACSASMLVVVLTGCQPAQPEAEHIRAVRTMQINGQGGTVAREFAGDIRARLETQLSFRVPGKITSRLVSLGDSVKSGQVLAQLDPTDLSLNQQAAKAGLLAAQAQASQAAADFKRFQELSVQGFISPAQLERYQTAQKTADANLAQARANALLQGNQASYSQLLAGGAGVITSIDAESGQVVGAGTPVFTVAYDGARDVVFSVPDNLGATMRAMVGKSGLLKVKIWGSDNWLSANVREVAAAADGATRTLLVKADLVGVQPSEANLGQTATVAFDEVSRIGQGMLLPLQALVECKGKSCVWVLNPQNMTVSQKVVVTAEVSGNQILIAQGLNPGQEIVIAGVHVLSPGQKVKRLKESGKVAGLPVDMSTVVSH
jgi:membrane fusion protein, multidrug efflux system